MSTRFALCAALLALAPTLALAAPCQPAPFGDTTLYLRGGLNNWAAQDEQAFEYRCNAYFLNLRAQGRQEFKIADEEWTAATTFGGNAQGQPERGAGGNLQRDFRGAHTLRLSFAADGRAHLDVGPQTFKPTPPRPITDRAATTTHFSSREAEFKTPFDVKITVPKGQIAVSNMPEASRVLSEDGRRTTFTFDSSPPLPLKGSSTKRWFMFQPWVTEPVATKVTRATGRVLVTLSCTVRPGSTTVGALSIAGRSAAVASALKR